MPSKKAEAWCPTDHACRECGGRVVQVTNAGPTGGGNPVYRCADCGNGSSGHGPSCVCWCGFRHRGQLEGEGGYRCVRIDLGKTDPVMRLALMMSGFWSSDPKCLPKAEVAVVTENCLRRASEKVSQEAK